METVFAVSGLVFLSGGTWLLSHWLDRWWTKKNTQAAFEGKRQRARSPTSRTPLARFHPHYTDWLGQIESKRTAQKLEQQQWMLAGIAFAVVYVLTRNEGNALLLAMVAFSYPVLQVRSGVKRVQREIAQEMRKVILLLQIYVKAGKSNVHAIKLVIPHVNGRIKTLLGDAAKLMNTMSFGEVMKNLAKESPGEELEMTAKALHLSAKNGTEVSFHLEQVLDQMNHNDRLQLGKERERQKYAVYMKFMLFFVTPLMLDVGLYAWNMFSGAFKAF